MQSTSGRKNPREGASILSVVFLWWMQDLMRLGNKRPLTEKDLFPLLQDYKAEVLIKKAEKFWLDELKRSQMKNEKPRLWKALMRLIPYRSGIAMILLRTLWSLSFVFLPVCLWLVLKTLNNRPNVDVKLAFTYVGLLGITSVIKAVSTQHYDYLTELWALKLKVAVIGLVYKKVLSLNRYGLEGTISGNIINLVSNDAQKVEKSLNQLGMVLSVPLELTISLVILWYFIGWEAFIGAAFFFILVTFQVLMARKAAKLREKAATFTDNRLAVMNEVISGIRAVKMYAWEWNYRDVLYELRRKEMAIIRLKGILIAVLEVLFHTTLPIAALISVTTLTLRDIHLSSFEIFTLLLGFVTIRFIFCYNLGLSVYRVTDAKVALDRIQTFLKDRDSNSVEHQRKDQLLTQQSGKSAGDLTVQYKSTSKTANRRKRSKQNKDSQTFLSNSTPASTEAMSHIAPLELYIDQETAGLSSSDQTSSSSSKEPFLLISDVSCSWNQDYLTETLTGITLRICKGEMLAVTGAVGSGKSSLLTAVLGELPLRKGGVSYYGKVAYVPQIPWVFSGTIRENILFGLPFNEERFQNVVHVCGLTKDLRDFTNGDLTEIGQRGVTLSGGQKARVGLARAVYSDADIYLLDDPLGAVDTKVGSRLFESCILGKLSGSVRLLATHQLQYLKNVDHIVVMENGSIINQGGYEELKEKGAFLDIVELLEPYEDEPESAERNSRQKTVEKLPLEPTGFAAATAATAAAAAAAASEKAPVSSDKGQEIMPLSDDLNTKNSHIISQKVYNNREPTSLAKFEGKRTMKDVLISSDGKDNASFSDKMLDLEVDDIMSPESVRLIIQKMSEPDQRPALDLEESEENKSSGTVTWQLYWRYFKEGTPVPFIILLLLLLILEQVCLLAPNWWLAKMAEMTRDEQTAPITQVVHACLVAVSIVVMVITSFFFYYLLLKAAENLHNKMTTATIKAPVLFYDTNPAGRILNRFSKDVGCMDDVLPPLFMQASVLCLFSICALLVPAITNYWLFLALLPIVGIYIYFGRYFLKSSRELKRIEAIKCSPVYSHITETAVGLEIVHSSNMNKTFLDRLQRFQDENTQAFFMVVSCNRWLAVRLDLLSSIFVTIVAVGAILITENPALAGLALTYALRTLDATQYGVRLASEVENLMTSVERVMSYTEIDPEPGYSTEAHPTVPWPNEGSVAIQDLSLVYFKGGPRVLKNITFSIFSKEKVGVVGRTGAGKSSLVSALFRMPEPLGKVLIDGVDIASINLQEARRSMAVITQDPVLFGGTLRRNLDPFSQYTDQQLWTALEEVQLMTLVKDLPGQLDFTVKESGTNLSVGERQLVCMARALVQKSKFIIMDEATANVDFKTDRLIQEVIRQKFKDSTVLTIAHRLSTIMDYDKVLVLDAGRVVEFDKPEVLIRNNGMFAEMVKNHNKSVKHKDKVQ